MPFTHDDLPSTTATGWEDQGPGLGPEKEGYAGLSEQVTGCQLIRLGCLVLEQVLLMGVTLLEALHHPAYQVRSERCVCNGGGGGGGQLACWQFCLHPSLAISSIVWQLYYHHHRE